MSKSPAPAGAANVKITAAHMRRGLRKHFPTGRCAIAFEVAQSTGFGANRHIDAVAMDLWPSHGLGLHAIEIKVERSDWRRELKDPAKAEQLARFCQFFWVAAPPGVVPVEELPPAWGLLEGGEFGMRVVKRADKTKAEPVTPEFLAAIFRAATERSIEADESKLALAALEAKLVADYADRVKVEAERLSTNNTEDAKNWRVLVDALGIIDPKRSWQHLWQSDADQLIRVIRAVHSSGLMDAHHGLSGLRESLKDMLGRVDAAVATLHAPLDDDKVEALRALGRRVKRSRR